MRRALVLGTMSAMVRQIVEDRALLEQIGRPH
jgi:hypothetical protein